MGRVAAVRRDESDHPYTSTGRKAVLSSAVSDCRVIEKMRESSKLNCYILEVLELAQQERETYTKSSFRSLLKPQNKAPSVLGKSVSKPPSRLEAINIALRIDAFPLAVRSKEIHSPRLEFRKKRRRRWWWCQSANGLLGLAAIRPLPRWSPSLLLSLSRCALGAWYM